MSRSYQQALDFLFARTTGAVRVGLERTSALLALLGNPHLRVPAFHVAGTNGKGSVCATLEALLGRRGLRVAKYTSPHLVDFRERILVDGTPMPQSGVVEWVERWAPDCERLGASFFEATTAMAFEHFAAAGADVAVIETGLGGRLDSTNVIERPVAAGVTAIAMDHTEYLGTTLDAIAGEKAGIFKPGSPAIVGDWDAHVRGLLRDLATQRGAAPVRVVAEECTVADVRVGAQGTRFTLTSGGRTRELATPLLGRHQAENALVALTMLDAAGPAYRLGDGELPDALLMVRLAGRFDRRGPYLFDVAHNPDGARVLAETLRLVRPERPVIALLTVLADKDWRGIMRALAPEVDAFLLTHSPTAPAQRGWDARSAHAFATEQGWAAEVERDFDEALARAGRDGATVVVTGSFHTVGDAMARLQLSPLPR